MQHYNNRSGESGVVAYEIEKDTITIQFIDGDRYLYTKRSAGADNIAKMQELAREGRGLSTYLNQHVRSRYARKLN